MKKFVVVVVAILSSTSFLSNAKDYERRPDSVYNETIANPALGADSSIGAINAPISEGIGSSLDIFSQKKKSIKTIQQPAVSKELEINNNLENDLKTTSDKEVEDEISKAFDFGNTETIKPQPKTEPIPLAEKSLNGQESNNKEQIVSTTEGAEKPTLIRAPRIPSDKIYINEADNKTKKTTDEVKYVDIKKSEDLTIKDSIDFNKNRNTISNIKPIDVSTKPVAELKVLNPNEFKVTLENPAKKEIKKEVSKKTKIIDNKPVEIEETYTTENLISKPIKDSINTSKNTPLIKSRKIDSSEKIPASLSYKASLDDNQHIKDKVNDDSINKSEFTLFGLLVGGSDKSKAAKHSEIVDKEVAKNISEENLELIDATSELPPVDSAKVGQCYSKATLFGEFKDTEEKILVKDAYQKTIEVPAEYKEVEEEVVIKEASTKMVTVPATYKEIEEEVVVSPEREEEVVISPAKYEIKTENTLVKPAHKSWVKEGDSDIMRLVEFPDEYKEVTNKILISEAVTQKKTIPAITKTIKKKVLDQEERVEKQVVPAETKTIKKQVLVHDAETKVIEVPAEYKIVKKKVRISPDKIVWMPIKCSDELDRDLVKRLQGALVAKGHDVKNVDGVFGGQTQKAVDEYQESLGFRAKGVALKTISSLGLQEKL